MIHHPLVLGMKLALLIVIAVVLLILRSVLTPEQFRVALWVGAAVFVFGTIALWVFAFRTLGNPNSRIGKQMIHSDQQRSADAAPSRQKLQAMIGARGVTASPLRPAGTAVFGEERLSVVTEGEYIDAGCQVEIVSAKGARVVVRPTRIGEI